jgi:hypothetical protein
MKKYPYGGDIEEGTTGRHNDPTGPPPPAMAPRQRSTAGRAIASRVLGLAGTVMPLVYCVAALLWGYLLPYPLATLAVCLVVSVVAIVLGHLSRRDVRRSAGLRGGGVAMAGVVLGYTGIAVFVLIGGIGVPSLLRTAIAANQASAERALRLIDTCEVAYASIYDKGYSPTLEALGRTGLIDDELAAGKKSGYIFTYQASEPDSGGEIIVTLCAPIPRGPPAGCNPSEISASGPRMSNSVRRSRIGFRPSICCGDCSVATLPRV